MNNQNETLEKSLFKHCAEGKTGTVLIATNNNKSCQIVLTEGNIVAVTMGRFKGHEAVLELERVGIKGASFNEKMQLPYTDAALISSSEAVLKLFGYDESKMVSSDTAVETVVQSQAVQTKQAQSDDIELEDILNNLQQEEAKKQANRQRTADVDKKPEKETSSETDEELADILEALSQDNTKKKTYRGQVIEETQESTETDAELADILETMKKETNKKRMYRGQTIED